MFKTVTLEVIGEDRLNCEGCEERVEDALKKVRGIGKVRARSSNQRIEVLFDSDLLDPAQLADRVTAIGYQTRLVSAD